ncbi:MAG: diaminopimelate decarboxylase [Alphaproteobacteria bacterium]
MTSAFHYQGGVLCAENVPLDAIAKEVGTPCYIYSTKQLQKNYEDFKSAFKGMDITIYYANKASPNQAVTRTLIECGAGVDITSVGELERALAAGAKPHKIIYSGVGKKREEIMAALLAGVHQLNVESIPELKQISAVAVELQKTASIALRVNPDVGARTYKKTSTAETGVKFGIDHAQIDEALKLATRLPGLAFKGFTIHLGSHVHDYEPYRAAYTKVVELVRATRAQGIEVSRLDLGGGVTIPYDGQTVAPFSEYAAIVMECIKDLKCEISFEPGRRLVGDAGVLLSRVTYDKQGVSKRFLILDAGMNDLIRPAMYEARHSIIPLRESKVAPKIADVVGPVCETSDLFGMDYSLPGIEQGDLVAILQAGAYSAAMASTYNGRPLIPEVLVSESQFSVVRRRIPVVEQIGWEALPPWMASA